jgi:hypothetical protein
MVIEKFKHVGNCLLMDLKSIFATDGMRLSAILEQYPNSIHLLPGPLGCIFVDL